MIFFFGMTHVKRQVQLIIFVPAQIILVVVKKGSKLHTLVGLFLYLIIEIILSNLFTSYERHLGKKTGSSNNGV